MNSRTREQVLRQVGTAHAFEVTVIGDNEVRLFSTYGGASRWMRRRRGDGHREMYTITLTI